MATPTRRQFLATSTALPLAGGALAARPAKPTADAVICILMTGGPSQLDTFDPKPDAPAEVRGPFGTIPTRTPGVRVSELFPKLAAQSHRWSLIRSMTSDAPPIHEVGMQLVNTGRRLVRDAPPWPSAGGVVRKLLGARSDSDAWYLIGGRPEMGAAREIWTGLEGWSFLRDQGPTMTVGGCVASLAGLDGTRLLTACFEYDMSIAALNVKWGARFVTVNMFPTVFDAPSWDCHADGGSLACDLGDYRDTVAPLFDLAVSKLLTDLHDRGLLDRTLVVATGEFGRTPKLNCNGGRDHWTGCWSTLVAGGGVRGGRVIGRSDRIAAEPADRPVTPAELVATIFHAVGIPADATIPGPDDKPVAVYNARPVSELF